MSTTTTQAKKISPEPVESLPEHTSLVGLDSEGRTHHIGNFATDKRVYVVDNGSVESFDLQQTPCDDLADWIDHVEDVCGWYCCWAELSLLELFEELHQ